VFLDETGAAANMTRRYGQGVARAASGRCHAARALAHHDLRGGSARERDQRSARRGLSYER
jgi:hypothetical protein